MIRFPSPRWRRVFAFLALVVAGCGGSGGTAVSGKVKFSDGSPLTKGTVFFEGDRSASGEINSDGTYKMGTNEPGDGVTPGKYRVYLGGDAAGGGYEESAPLVSSKFLIPSESGLSIDVGSSSMTYDITVEPPQEAPAPQ
jgi:hypothetical protein